MKCYECTTADATRWIDLGPIHAEPGSRIPACGPCVSKILAVSRRAYIFAAIRPAVREAVAS